MIKVDPYLTTTQIVLGVIFVACLITMASIVWPAQTLICLTVVTLVGIYGLICAAGWVSK